MPLPVANGKQIEAWYDAVEAVLIARPVLGVKRPARGQVSRHAGRSPSVAQALFWLVLASEKTSGRPKGV
jgi:hypothetical protein